jgi:hypothetical protein
MHQFKIIFSFDAENDIFRALDYYQNINPKLASKK